MSTRANLHIEDEALIAAKSYANARGITLGLAVSELILRGEQAPEQASTRLKRGSHGYLVMKKTGRAVTPETVRQSSEDDLD